MPCFSVNFWTKKLPWFCLARKIWSLSNRNNSIWPITVELKKKSSRKLIANRLSTKIKVQGNIVLIRMSQDNSIKKKIVRGCPNFRKETLIWLFHILHLHLFFRISTEQLLERVFLKQRDLLKKSSSYKQKSLNSLLIRLSFVSAISSWLITNYKSRTIKLANSMSWRLLTCWRMKKLLKKDNQISKLIFWQDLYIFFKASLMRRLSIF